jgi:mannose-6-phosphate isomerase-like protein (cupin superfamily)
MKKIKISFKQNWKVIQGSRRSQAAEMVIPPGDSEGGPNNKHSGDQWLYVVEGTATAIINGTKHVSPKGTLLFIENGARHEIKNNSKKKLKTLNFYSPPQY